MKKVFALMLCFIMAFGCAAFAEEPIRIAYSTNGLSNPQMAETADHMVTYAQEKYGATLVFADADSDANTQIMQIENFIQSGVDALILSPIDRMLWKRSRQRQEMRVSRLLTLTATLKMQTRV